MPVSRPDPREIRRRPMARGAAAFAIRKASAVTGVPRPLFIGQTLDLHLLHILLETAEAIVEGAAYTQAAPAVGDAPTFSGTALIDLDLANVPTQPRTPAIARRLARALHSDVRVAPIVHARAAAAMSALLGAHTPGAWHSSFRARAVGLCVRIDVDMEAVVHTDAPSVEGLGLG